jgi:uncharacterized protein (TIGR02145 family)
VIRKIKNWILLVIIIKGLLILCISCKNTVTDIDGNIYNTIKIGKNVWMVENLKTTRYSNGDHILNVTDSIKWCNLSTGAYSNYDNDADNYPIIYGRLYNWYAVKDSRNLAPDGWHVATDAEWELLVAYLGGENIAGDKLKEKGIAHWHSINTRATNETGFSALPGGARFTNKNFSCINLVGFWWSSSELNEDNAWVWRIGNDQDKTYKREDNKHNGYSVRCVRD